MRFYRFITIAVLAVGLISCASKAESEAPATPSNPAQIAETVLKCDGLFKQREDPAKLREAIKSLAAVRNPDQRNYEVEWKFAKYNYFLGKQSKDEKEADKAFEDGAQAGRIASRIEPNKADGYFWYGANLGEQAKRSPVTVGIKSIDDIREAMNKVIEIQPDYQNGSAYDALGQLELATRLTTGDAKKAVEYLEKGMAVDGDNSNIRLHLAEAYLAVKRDTEARKQLDFILQMKPNPDYVVEHQETVEKAKKLLAERF